MVKVTLLGKLLILLLLLTVLPLSLLGFLALNDAKKIGYEAVLETEILGVNTLEKTTKITNTAIADSTEALNYLGMQIIKLRAEAVAKQIEVYMKDHPNMGLDEYKNDKYFTNLAIQKVGDKGYTYVLSTNFLEDDPRIEFHPAPSIVNKPGSIFRESQPSTLLGIIVGSISLFISTILGISISIKLLYDSISALTKE